MQPFSEGLKRLHDLQRALKEAQDHVSRGPKQIAAKEAAVKKRQDEVDARKLTLKQTRLLADQKGLQLKTCEAKILDLKAKLNTAGTNREYESLTGQIAADTMAKSVLEDEILEVLERVDACQVSIREAEDLVKVTQGELAQTTEMVKATAAGWMVKVEELTAQVLEAENIIPADLKVQYRRLTHAHGCEALASVMNQSCSGCYVSMTSQRFMELRNGKPLFCSTCGRLQYAISAEG